jgi:uncharacterized flavoprotein (TIGR03862 family)
MNTSNIAIIGGGPAGLIAAEKLSAAGQKVTVYERKPTLGRKFLMAGRGGLNLTHTEPLERFLERYGQSEKILRSFIEKFSPENLRAWCESLGQPTFIGSSGRIFPQALKSSPLLRAWIERLEQAGVRFALQHEWIGWNGEGNLTFLLPDGGRVAIQADATLLALGGGSWAKLGSDGAWMNILREKNIPLMPLQPSNCGFTVQWSDHFRKRYAGQPLKTVTATFAHKTIQGEIMITAQGVEGGAIYALSADIRDTLQNGPVTLMIDLKPGLSHDNIQQKLETPRKGRSLSTHLQKTVGLTHLAITLLYEFSENLPALTTGQLANLIKALPLTLTSPFPIERAISTAGGVMWDAVTPDLMLKSMPGVFVAGEMLDWEAPTGGYLLQATFSTGVAAADGILNWLSSR